MEPSKLDLDEPVFQRLKDQAHQATPPADADFETQQEIANLNFQKSKDEHEKLLVEIDQLKEHKNKLALRNKDLEQNINFRKHFSIILFGLTCFWIIIVTVLIVKFSRPHGFFSDTVSVTLLGTTTIGVFAFFRCVTNYLFPSPQNHGEADNAEKDAPKSAP